MVNEHNIYPLFCNYQSKFYTWMYDDLIDTVYSNTFTFIHLHCKYIIPFKRNKNNKIKNQIFIHLQIYYIYLHTQKQFFFFFDYNMCAILNLQTHLSYIIWHYIFWKNVHVTLVNERSITKRKTKKKKKIFLIYILAIFLYTTKINYKSLHRTLYVSFKIKNKKKASDISN